MDTTLFKQMKQWVKNETGTPATFLWLWSIITAAFSVLFMVLAPVWWTILLGLAVLAAIAFCNKKILDWTKAKAKSTPRSFFILKKSMNYLAFAQFCFQSVALVLAWSRDSINDTGYYVLYALAMVANLLYLPVFFAFVNKKNQAKHGILEMHTKRGKTVFQPVKLHGGIFASILSWVDALVWAASMVIFINSLIFQLYQIPTESMVPELYVGTRVFTVKTFTNPEIPLSLVKIPVLAGVNRFDKMVISNPRYAYKKEQVLADFASNFLYMVSFTLIKNPKLDENGQEIADPLIKRTIGMPGEQLMMVDDVVYVKTAEDAEFKVLPDESKYSYTFASDRTGNVPRIRQNYVTAARKKTMRRWDAEKNAITAESYQAAATGYSEFFTSFKPADFKKIIAQMPPNQEKPSLIMDSSKSIDISALATYALWLRDDPAGFKAELAKFLDAPFAEPATMNLWKQGAMKTNLLFKLKFCAGLKALLEQKDTELSEVAELQSFAFEYVKIFYERRNFAPFPGENAYLPKDQYFFMGDNRYNSVDGRHWSTKGALTKPLFEADPYSLRYWSELSPFGINKSRLKGKALFSVF